MNYAIVYNKRIRKYMVRSKEKIDKYCIIMEWFNDRELAELELFKLYKKFQRLL